MAMKALNLFTRLSLKKVILSGADSKVD